MREFAKLASTVNITRILFSKRPGLGLDRPHNTFIQKNTCNLSNQTNCIVCRFVVCARVELVLMVKKLHSSHKLYTLHHHQRQKYSEQKS